MMTTPPPGWYPDDRGTPLPYPDDDPKGLSSGRKWIIGGVAAGAVVGVAAVVVLAGVVGYAIRGGDDAAAGGAPTAAAPTETLPVLPPSSAAHAIEQPSLQQIYLDRVRERVPVADETAATYTGINICVILAGGRLTMEETARELADKLVAQGHDIHAWRWVVYGAREVLCPWVAFDFTITPTG